MLICLPGSDIPQVQDWLSKIYFDKWVHAGLFGMMGLLFMFPITRSSLQKKEKLKWLSKIVIAIILWGITTEFIQKFYIPGRFFDLLDWTADSFGTICAYILNKIWLNKRERTVQN